MIESKPTVEMPNGLGGLIYLQKEHLYNLNDLISSFEKMAEDRFGYKCERALSPSPTAENKPNNELHARVKELISFTNELEKRTRALFDFLDAATA